jgi:hypothetical protein
MTLSRARMCSSAKMSFTLLTREHGTDAPSSRARTSVASKDPTQA